MEKTSENRGGESRRSFLAKLGIGIASIAGISTGLFRFGGLKTESDGFPGPDSIFHPASDPRSDPRRHN